MKTLLVVLLLSGAAAPQDNKQPITEISSSPEVSTCMNASNDIAQKECEKRDTARLFMLAGKPESALRVLCNTRVAIEAFRPYGSGDKFEESAAANSRCLQANGLEPKAK
jgi:hypothetical protein